MKIKSTILLFVIAVLILPSLFCKGDIVFDPTNFVANYGTFGKQIAALIKQIEEVNHLRTQIQNQVTQIKYMATNTASLQYLMDLKKSWEEMDKAIKGTVGEAGDFESMHAEFEDMYPDLNALPDLEITGINFQEMCKKNYNNVTKTMANAMASQAILEKVRNEKNESDKLLAQSQAAEGQKQVMQVSNQYLALLGTKMDRLATVVAAQNKADTAYFQKEIQEQEDSRIQGQEQIKIDVEALKKQEEKNKQIAKKHIYFQ
jgi:P-type conjugative transfer protein TrbJ